MRSICAALFLASPLALSFGCGSELGSDTADATDSFAKPTYHGDVQFGESQRASFTSQSRFHAWTFELSGDATVTLQTQELSANVDTVMYLYRAGAGSSKSGANIMSNDDHGGSLASRLDAKLPAGRYLVQVKAHKTQVRGSFTLLGQCSGDGCPKAPAPLDLESECEIIDHGVGDCVGDDGGTLGDCSPTDDPVALQCCHAGFGGSFCEVTCESYDLPLADADLDFVYDHADDYGGIHSAKAYVASCGFTLEEVVSGARALRSEQQGLRWPSGTSYELATSNDAFTYAKDSSFFEAMAAIARSDQFESWYASIEMPCQACSQYEEKWLFFYPETGTVIELEGTYGHD